MFILLAARRTRERIAARLSERPSLRRTTDAAGADFTTREKDKAPFPVRGRARQSQRTHLNAGDEPMAQESQSVDLGADFGKEPKVDASGKDVADSISQSPLSQSRGGADPIDIGPGSVQTDFDAIPVDSYAAVDDDKGASAAYDSSSKGDAVNDHAWSLGNPRYEPKY